MAHPSQGDALPALSLSHAADVSASGTYRIIADEITYGWARAANRELRQHPRREVATDISAGVQSGV
jgi:hypothetical protein